MFFLCFHQRILQRVVRTSFEKQLDPRGPIASRGVSVPERLRTPIATYDFPGVPDPLPPPGSAHEPAPPFFSLVIARLERTRSKRTNYKTHTNIESNNTQ